VGVYKDAFAQDQFPFQGEWLMTIQDAKGNTLMAQRPVSLVYSHSTNVYWGYSAGPESPATTSDATWIEVTAFDPNDKRIEVRVRDLNGLDETAALNVSEVRPHSSYSSGPAGSAKYVIQIARRN
jgi:hypothetical protein